MVQKVPRVVRLPGGYEVRVQLLSRKLADTYIGKDIFAQWEVDKHLISLRTDRKGKARAEDFIHEMEHAIVDWKDWFLGKSEM